jgi:hypothetical protein
MTYWLVLSTLSWSMSFSVYPDLAACEDAAKAAPWYVSTTCLPRPAPIDKEHKH